MFSQRFFFLAKRFVAGETIDTALEAVAALNAVGMTATLDFLGEDVTDRVEADCTRDMYFAMLAKIASAGARTNVSVKLTALGLFVDEDFCVENLAAIVERAAGNRRPVRPHRHGRLGGDRRDAARLRTRLRTAIATSAWCCRPT